MSEFRHSVTTLDQAARLYREGFWTDAEWEQYRCDWRNGAPRFSDECGEHDGHDPKMCPRVQS